MAMILAYQLPGKQLSALRVIAVRLGMRVCVVRPEEYGEKLEDLLCGTAVGAAEGGRLLPAPMLVFAGCDGTQVQSFLAGWRKAGIPPVACKAMLTDTNKAWSSYALYEELWKEHQAMRAGDSAHEK